MHKGKGMKFVGDSRISAEKKANMPKDYSEYPGRTEAFWPNFLLKEWLVGAVFLIGFLCVTIAHPSPLEGMADPTNASYIPLPDWYFLFLYELLKYKFASGPYILFGILVIPGLAFGALFLAPFLDKGPGRRPHQRPVAVGMMLLAVASVMWLTYESAEHVDWEARAEANKPVASVEVDKEDPGYKVFESNCMSCHGDSLQGGAAAPSLIGIDRSAEEIMKIAQEGTGSMPPGVFKGTDEELKQLAEFIVSVNEQAK
ncbi:menaquinol-cytochrome c reductase cytochrome b/c subunit [Virgibacillus oceani]|uniref:Menaquinol:cytochrome c reductase cytochrome c subunit n=1 Tax=Virgibacillus oceani TaxID=1479511 RepID=A0A917H302_9BACI|nr:menaquinol-cytochrome c reductase cytochrome b/c subunit [Virgibacillus oceani]GGG65373.1 menaquinol-cytochrome c reductase cytochrome b/c subunit [Virgibacillus oceani]